MVDDAFGDLESMLGGVDDRGTSLLARGELDTPLATDHLTAAVVQPAAMSTATATTTDSDSDGGGRSSRSDNRRVGCGTASAMSSTGLAAKLALNARGGVWAWCGCHLPSSS